MCKMDVVFVNPYPEFACGINEGTVEPPLGLGYLAAVAETCGLSCKIIDASLGRVKLNDLFQKIVDTSPEIVGISVNSYSYKCALKLTDRIKSYSDKITVMLGGPTPSSIPLKIINSCSADAIVVGEGEEILKEIIGNYRNRRPLFKDVKGVIYKNGTKVIDNGPRGFIKDLDSIPFPAYHLLPDMKTYKSRSRRKPVGPLITSRGCPYQCIFCSKDVFKNVCRKRSPELVLEEIDMLVRKYGAKQIDILDDNFSVDKDRMERILDLIIERKYDLCINLQSGVRTENLDKYIIEKMRRANVWKLPIGVESGDPNVLKKIKKQLNLDKVLEITRIAKRNGIKTYGFFIIGLPGDTPESMQRTIDFAIKMDPNIANFAICIPFPGTELHKMVKRSGRFLIDVDNGIDAGFYANRVFYEMDGLDSDMVLKYYKKAFKDFYFRPKKIIELVLSINSWSELVWFFQTGFSVIKNLWKRKSVS